MCELFGMNAKYPARVNESIALLQPRGGLTGPHADGWGLALFEENCARIFKEAAPAAESQCLTFMATHNLASKTVIAHIRKANPVAFGRTAANTHPFERELRGRSWVFAHNGKLDTKRLEGLPLSGRFSPVGDTDSERAFCYILDAIASVEDTEAEVAKVLRHALAELTQLGEFNMLLSDGRRLYAYANTRLHKLGRRCHEEGCRQVVTLLATKPLTNEPWQEVELKKLHVFTDGAWRNNRPRKPSTDRITVHTRMSRVTR